VGDYGLKLPIELNVPDGANECVVFSHATGKGLDSGRGSQVADNLNTGGIATLRSDMLTEKEIDVPDNYFDVPLLTTRLLPVTEWVRTHTEIRELRVGYFGASIGAVPAFRAAVESEDPEFVVSRGGRIDMTPRSVDRIKLPFLLIVGGNDQALLEHSRRITDQKTPHGDLYVLEGAAHANLTDEHLDELGE